MTGGPAPALRPIATADLPAVGRFLHAELNPRLSADRWAAALRPTWPGEAPNHGFALWQGDDVVGVQAAFYSERGVAGRSERFCNLAAWCVRPEHRAQGVRLLRAVLAQRGYHFTDLSPSGSVVEVNRRLRFAELDTRTVVVPHLPLARSRAEVLEGVDAVAPHLDAAQRRLLEDHRGAAAAWHVLVRDGDRSCYLVLRRERRKRLPVFASVLHASDPGLLRDGGLRALGAHLLRRHGVLATLAEQRVLGFRPAGVDLARPRPRMYRPERGRDLDPGAVDGLYSELTCVAW